MAKSDARDLAFDILTRVENGGAYASILLDQQLPRLADSRDAALLNELVLGVLRRRATLDFVLGRVATRPLADLEPPVLLALRLGAYMLLYLDRVPDFAAVDRTVDLVKRSRRFGAVGFVNAVLRSVARQGAELLPPPPQEGDSRALARFYSFPEWWVARRVERSGWAETEMMLSEGNRPAAKTVRPNLRRCNRSQLAERLGRAGVTTEASVAAANGLYVRSGGAAVAGLLAAGDGWAQDEASQLVVEMFGSEPVARIADLCAAPGTKSLQLAEGLAGDGLLVAFDRHAGRLGRMQRMLRRLAVEQVFPVRADLTRNPPTEESFDRVLLDAPCSGTGTLRRHPEIRWRLDPQAPAAFGKRQLRLLSHAAGLVGPRGTLVYSVCSVEEEEGTQVVDAFLATHPEFVRDDPRPSLLPAAAPWVDEQFQLRTRPDARGMDGFFAARLIRG